MRILRQTPTLRRLVAETRVTVDDLIAPVFVREDIDEPQPIESLPGVMQHTQESIRAEVKELVGLGIPGVVLFGLPGRKDSIGSEAWNPDGVIQVALKNLRDDQGVETQGGDGRRRYRLREWLPHTDDGKAHWQ